MEMNKHVDTAQLNRAIAPEALRILASCNIRHGGNDYSFVRAFRRAGHSVLVVPPESFIPRWETKRLRILRRLARSAIVAEYNRELRAAARAFQPDLFFVFKGDSVTATTVEAVRASGIVVINFYPDTSFDHAAVGAIGCYDWVFTTKPTHIDFLKQRYTFSNATFVTHAFDPEVHASPKMVDRDWQRYGCDVVFIGNTSKEKERLLTYVMEAIPEYTFKIWGSHVWRQAPPPLCDAYQGSAVWGQEYSKAINGAKINLGLLYEGSLDAPAGDVITARTFEIPAAGGFMLHERTDEVMRYFEEGKECAFFNNADDLVAKIRYYVEHEERRLAIAAAGRRRALTSGYSYDDRVATVLEQYHKLRAAQMPRRR